MIHGPRIDFGKMEQRDAHYWIFTISKFADRVCILIYRTSILNLLADIVIWLSISQVKNVKAQCPIKPSLREKEMSNRLHHRSCW